MTPRQYVAGHEEAKSEEQQRPINEESYEDITPKLKRKRGGRSKSRETM